MSKILLENVLKISAWEFRKYFKKEIRQRNLILHGDCDNIVPLLDILDFCKTQKNTKIIILKGTDHRFKNRGEIDKVIQVTRKFLNI